MAPVASSVVSTLPLSVCARALRLGMPAIVDSPPPIGSTTATNIIPTSSRESVAAVGAPAATGENQGGAQLREGSAYLGPVLRSQLEALPLPLTAQDDSTHAAAGIASGDDSSGCRSTAVLDLLLDSRLDVDVATSRCLRFPASMSVGDCAILFSLHRCKHAFVTTGGILVGCLSLDTIDARSSPMGSGLLGNSLPRPPHLTTYLTTEANGLPRDSHVMAC